MAKWTLRFLGAVALAFSLTVALSPMPAGLRDCASVPSVRIVDRHGMLLHEVRAADGTLADGVAEQDLDGRVARAVIAAEDKHFYSHFGIDPVAMVRAFLRNIRARRVVSGASTLSMQLARTLVPHRRGWWGKWRESALAVRMEMSASKREILRAYMNAAPFGPQTRGARRAARASFGKELDGLSWAEAATIAGLPKSPVAYKMRVDYAPTLKRRNAVLERLYRDGALDGEALKVALAEPLRPWTETVQASAPHFVNALMRGALGELPARDGLRVLRTSLSAPLQAFAEREARERIARLAEHDAHAASVLVLENATGDVLAYVGSPDFDEPTAGQNDGVLAERQPGSALKPFVYALAMERAGYTAATLLADVSTRFQVGAENVYAPKNYDGRFHGPVRVREALANSYNVPAVRAAEAVGASALLDQLRALGLGTLRKNAEDYGIGLALGDGEVRLWDLAYAYAALARGGEQIVPRALMRAEYTDAAAHDMAIQFGARAVDAKAAQVVTDILADPVARATQFGRHGALEFDSLQVAAKTGTSKHYRDNWAVGYTREVTVAVWVGNFDGHAMRDVSGVTGAGPLMHAVLESAMSGRHAAALATEAREGVLAQMDVCALSGALPGPHCEHRIREWFDREHVPSKTCAIHVHARVERDTGLLVGPSCDGRAVEERVFENYDAELSVWAREAARPLLPGPSLRCPPVAVAAEHRAFRVLYPTDGTRYVLDASRPRGTQSVRVEVGPLHDGERVDLLVDGTTRLRSVHAADLMWPLEPGAHELRVQRASGEVANVKVHVE